MISRLSIVMPAFNEAHGIGQVIQSWANELTTSPAIHKWEIIVCDDASTDNTSAIVENLIRIYSQVRLTKHSTNKGASAAAQTALKEARYDWVLFVDADGQFPPKNLQVLLHAANQNPNAPAISGARIEKQDNLSKRAGARISTFATNRAHRTHLHDASSIFKLVRRDVLLSLRLESTGLNLSVELTSKILEIGIIWVEVPIHHQTRRRGKPSWNFIDGALRRGAFVAYIAFRQALIHHRILDQPTGRYDHE